MKRWPVVLLLLAASSVLLLLARPWGGEGMVGGAERSTTVGAAATRSGEPSPEAPVLAGTPRGYGEPDDREGVPAVAGRVLDAADRRPVAGARVVAWSRQTDAPEETRTDANGRFRLPGTTGRETAFHLHVSADGYAPGVERRVLASRDPQVVLLVRGGFVEGRLVEPGGQRPVTDAVVRLLRATFQPGEEVMPEWETLVAGSAAEVAEPVPPVPTGLDGRFRLGPVARGSHALVFLRDGQPPFTFEPVVVPAEGTVDVGEVEAPQVAPFLAKILDAATGEPLRGVTFRGRSLLDGRYVEAPVRPLEIREGGVYVLPSLRATLRYHNAVVVAARDGYGSVALGPVVETDGDAFVFRLVRNASLAGDVRDDAGAPLPAAVVSVRADTDRGLLAMRPADREGRFSFPDLPAGVDLEVVVHTPAEDRVVTVAPLRLAPGEERRVSLGGSGDPSLRGVVRSFGAPIAGALVAVDGPTGRRTIVYADAAGRFRVDGLAPGEHEVFVGAASGAVQVTRHVLLEAGAPRVLDLDLARRVRGVVLLERTPGAEPREPPRVVLRPPEGSSASWRVEADVDAEGRFEALLPEASTSELTVEEEGWHVPAPLVVDARAADVEGLTLRVVEDPMTGVVEIRLEDAETGAPVAGADYRYAWRRTSGAGTVGEDGVLRDGGLGLGRHQYVFDASDHVAAALAVDVTPDQREAKRTLALQRSNAVRIVDFQEPSRGREAGLEVGDLLLRYGDVPTPTRAALVTAAGATRADDLVRLEILRGGVPRVLTVPGGRLGVRIVNAVR